MNLERLASDQAASKKIIPYVQYSKTIHSKLAPVQYPFA